MDANFMRDFESYLKQLEYTIIEDTENASIVAGHKIGEAGEKQIREFVETRGLDKQWKKAYISERSGRKRDRSTKERVDSGQMRDSIHSKTTVSGNVVTVAMGWFNPDSDREMPINFQEFGFTHDNGDWIEGMNSLEDTLIFIQENIWSLVEPNEIIKFGPATTRGGREAAF